MPDDPALLLLVDGSALGDCAHGAGTGAAATVQAGAGIDYVMIITLRDRTNGAGICTGPTADAGIADNVRHKDTPPIKCTYILPHLFKKSMIIYAEKCISRQRNGTGGGIKQKAVPFRPGGETP